MTALNAWRPTSILEMEHKVDKQVAALAETRTPNLQRAKNRSHKSAVGDSGDSAGRNNGLTKTKKNPLDSDRPSHGRRLRSQPGCW